LAFAATESNLEISLCRAWASASILGL
jgi:hypothetical protein